MDTTTLGIEYAEGTDAIRDWPAISQASAESIDALIAAAIAPPTVRTASVVVANTVTETDLTGGSFIVPAGALGTKGRARLRLRGDMLNNTGAQQFSERFKVKLGAAATVVLDTNSDVSNNGGAKPWGVNLGATRSGWLLEVEIQNLGVANAQLVRLDYWRDTGSGNTSSSVAFVVGAGAGQSFAGQNGSAGYRFGGYNTAAIDTTAAMAIAVTVINPVASASFETKAIDGILEVVQA